MTTPPPALGITGSSWAGYVPRAFTGPLYPLTVAGDVVGESPVDTRDDDASYVGLVTNHGSLRSGLGITGWDRTDGAAPPAGVQFTRLSLEARWRKGPATSSLQAVGWAIAVNGFTRVVFALDAYADSSWVEQTQTVVELDPDAADNSIRLAAVAAFPEASDALGWQLYSLEPSFGGVIDNRITYLRMWAEWGGQTYRRNFQRDDGLGTNARRNFGATSRQGSRRNHGYR